MLPPIALNCGKRLRAFGAEGMQVAYKTVKGTGNFQFLAAVQLRFSVHSEYAVTSLDTAPRKPSDILKIRPLYRRETSRTNYPEARDVTCQTLH